MQAHVERMNTLVDIRTGALSSLKPPPRIALSDWIEANIKPPEGVSALTRRGPALALSARHRRRDQRSGD
jgi:hypothetical protein